MIDGVFSQGEWQNAICVDVPGTAKLYFQRSVDFVYIAVQYTNSPSGIVDLYLSPREGEVYDLHASANLAYSNFLAIRSLIGVGGTIAIGLPTFLTSIPSRNGLFYLPRSAIIKFGIHVLPPALGV